MLRNIDTLLTGDILKTLNDLGHNDRVLVADANFPWRKYDVPTHRIGTSTVAAMRAILRVFPLETIDGDAVIVRTEHDGDDLNDLQLQVRELARAEHGEDSTSLRHLGRASERRLRTRWRSFC
jgi:L-fucose mutarotase